MTSVPAVVLGATGYVGGELLRLIATHPLFDLVAAVSESRAGERIPDTFPHLATPFDDAEFVTHAGFLAVAGGVLKSVPTFAEENFVLPPDEEIEKRITPRTKAILVNSPCNPSGKIFSGEEITGDWHMEIDQWISTAGYQRAHSFMFQYYDERFKGVDNIEESVLDVYMPVKKAVSR